DQRPNHLMSPRCDERAPALRPSAFIGADYRSAAAFGNMDRWTHVAETYQLLLWSCALDLEQLDIEHERRARLNGWRAPIAVGKLRRTDDAALTAGLHRLQGFGPARDDGFEGKGFRTVPLARAIEHRPVGRRPLIVDCHRVLRGRRCSR